MPMLHAASTPHQRERFRRSHREVGVERNCDARSREPAERRDVRGALGPETVAGVDRGELVDVVGVVRYRDPEFPHPPVLILARVAVVLEHDAPPRPRVGVAKALDLFEHHVEAGVSVHVDV
jgi:hypothetical protein